MINSRDVTARRQIEANLQRSETYLKALFDYAPDAYYLNDLEGRFVDGNHAAEELIGYKKEELIGESFLSLQILPIDELETAAGILTQSTTGPIGPVRLTLRRKDGRLITVEIRSMPLELNGQTLILGIARDITERQSFEAQLCEAKEAAEAANRAKSEFLANMSHEIRTPMNGIIGMTELALQTELTAEQRECLQMVAASGEALVTVINDVLDFSKIEAGKLDLDPVAVEIRDVVDDAVRPLAVRAHLKGLDLAYEVRADVPEVVVVDPHRLRQVLINLVGNATKFTEQGEVLVSVESERQTETEEYLHFSIRDTGVGIAPEKQQAIFEAFEQADSTTTRRFGGSGLGLTISRKLVEMMGGRLWVESEVDRGSTFHFTVRCQRSAEKPAPKPATLTELCGVSVLVVDDNATNRRILNGMLTRWLMRPTTVDGGRAALGCLMHAAAAGAPFPLVLIDVHMPEMGGFELVERIKRTPELAGATIMMLSSADLTGEAARCRELGVTAFLTKPIRQADLRDAILQALGAGSPDALEVHRPDAHTPGRRLHVLLAEDNAVNQRVAVRHAGEGRPHGRCRRQWPRGVGGLREGGVRPRAHGRADARDGRFRGHGGAPRTRTSQRLPCADRGSDGARHARRRGTLPARRNGRLRLQADPPGDRCSRPSSAWSEGLSSRSFVTRTAFRLTTARSLNARFRGNDGCCSPADRIFGQSPPTGRMPVPAFPSSRRPMARAWNAFKAASRRAACRGGARRCAPRSSRTCRARRRRAGSRTSTGTAAGSASRTGRGAPPAG